MQCLFAIPAGVIVFFLPDTPRWYYARNKIDQGDAALVQIYGEDIDSEAVQETKRHIMTAIEIELEANATLHWQHFLTMGIVDRTQLKIIRRLIICFWLPFVRLLKLNRSISTNERQIGEWMGVSLLAYFAPVILQGLRTSPVVIAVVSGAMATCMFLGTIPVYWYVLIVLNPERALLMAISRTIEKYGRRSTMLYSAIASSLLYVIFIILVAIGKNKAAQWASVGVLFVITAVLTYGWQATKFLYSSEIAPLEYRHIGAAFFSSGEWLMVFITVFASPIGLETCGWSFWIFILTGNVVAVVFVYLLCPETSGKTLEQGKDHYMKRSGGIIKLIDMQSTICLSGKHSLD